MDSDDTRPLSRMIRQAAERLRYEDLADRSVDPETGQQASRALLNNIANGNVKRMPPLPHLRAIAAGLGVPIDVVRQAAARQWLDWHAEVITDDDDALTILVHLGQMTERRRREVRRIVETLADDVQ